MGRRHPEAERILALAGQASFAQIAVTVGNGVTRNIVAGVVWRHRTRDCG